MTDSNNHPFCQCLFFSAGALARKLGQMAEEAFGKTGLAPSYGFLLMSLNQNPGVTAGELAQTMILSPSTVTRLVDKMVAEGYIERQKEGKFRILMPTKKSLGLQEDLVSSWGELFKNYNARIGEESAAKLTGEVYRAVEALE